MIHRFVDLLEVEILDPIVIFIIRRWSGGTNRTFALAGGGAPYDILSMPSTGTSAGSIEEPELSPDGTEYIWKRIVSATSFPEIRLAPSSDPGGVPTVLASVSIASSNIDILGWSPDGQQVFYRCQGPATQDTEVRVVDRDGTNDTLLWTSTAIKAFSWGQRGRVSPDGTQIALWCDEVGTGDEGLWVMDSDGTNMTQIYVADNGAYPTDFYGWSPDGNWLLVVDSTLSGGPGATWTIMKMDSSGGSVVNISTKVQGSEPLLFTATGPVWTADSSAVAVYKELGGTDPSREVGILLADGSETYTALSPQQLSYATMLGRIREYGPVIWGDRIYFVLNQSDGTQQVCSTDYTGADFRVDMDMDTDPIADDYAFNGWWQRAS